MGSVLRSARAAAVRARRECDEHEADGERGQHCKRRRSKFRQGRPDYFKGCASVCAAPSVRIIASQSEPIGIAAPHNRGKNKKGPEGMTPAGPEICEWCAMD